jgi:hypothetical protein
MPTYDIDCPCGAQDTYASMSAIERLPRAGDGRLVGHRKCGQCGIMTPQTYRTPVAGHIDGKSDAQPFGVPGMEGVFTSRRQAEKAAEAQNKDLQHTSNGEWKRTKYRSRQAAEALATEMGYSSLGKYKEVMKVRGVAETKANEARERKGEART